MHTRRLLAATFCMLTGCGSKSGLSQLTVDNTGGVGGITTGGSGGYGGNTTGGSGGAATGGAAGSGGVPMADCVYSNSGPPLLVFTWVDGVRAPLLAPLRGGSPGVRAEVAVAATHEHFWHPDIRVAKVSFGSDGLTSLKTDQKMLGYGVDSHGTGHLVRTENGELNLLYYHGDEASASVVPGIRFRRFNANAWKPLPELSIEDNASFAFDLAVGPSVTASGAYAGAGRFIAWRSASIGGGNAAVRVGVVSDVGKFVRGPLVAAGPGTSSQFGAAVAWTGSDYLVASNDFPCTDEKPCSNGITISRLVAGSAGTASLVQSTEFPADPNLRARTPQLDAFDNRAYVVWREFADGASGQQVLRAAVLGGAGENTGAEWSYATEANAGPILLASDQGAAVLYGEPDDSDGPENALGHSRIRLKQHGKSGQPLQTLDLQTTALTSGIPYSAAAVDHPRGLLIAWTGEATLGSGATHSSLYLSFLRCEAAID